MNNDNIDVEVKITPEDIYSYQKTIIIKNISPITIIILALIFLLVTITSVVNGVSSNEFPTTAVAVVLILLILAIFYPRILKKSANKTYENYKLIQKEQRYQINNDGIDITYESGHSFIKWKELYKAIETKENFLLFVSKQQAHIIPKRFLNQNEEHLIILRNFIKNAPTPKEKKVFANRSGILFLIYLILLILILVVITLYSSN